MSGYRAVRPENNVFALGWAVSHLMTKPAFANLKFGEWSRILVGQINRGHFLFAIDDKDAVRGFVGWAKTRREHAEAWVEGRRPLAYEDCLAGDCVVFNAWSADNLKVHRFLVDEGRKILEGNQTAYFKRVYPNGEVRPTRLTVNDFVSSHLRRRADGETSAGARGA